MKTKKNLKILRCVSLVETGSIVGHINRKTFDDEYHKPEI